MKQNFGNWPGHGNAVRRAINTRVSRFESEGYDSLCLLFIKALGFERTLEIYIDPKIYLCLNFYRIKMGAIIF